MVTIYYFKQYFKYSVKNINYVQNANEFIWLYVVQM